MSATTPESTENDNGSRRTAGALVNATLALLLLASATASAQTHPTDGRPPEARDPKLFSDEGVPVPGDAAPPLKLRTLDGNKEVNLASFRGKKPVVLVFTSYTCPPFRRQSPDLEAMYRGYKDRVEFFLVYVREIHPSDGWQLPANETDNVLIKQPQTRDERAKAARSCRTGLKLTMPFLMDGIDDAAQKAWHAYPGREWLIGEDGRIVYRGARAPNLNVKTLRGHLQKHLRERGISDVPTPQAKLAPAATERVVGRKDE